MIELNGTVEQMFKQLRETLSSIKGAKSINETLSLSYVVEVDDKSDFEAVEKVGGLLSSQAQKYGFILEVAPVTSEDVEKSKELFAKHLANQTKFKA